MNMLYVPKKGILILEATKNLLARELAAEVEYIHALKKETSVAHCESYLEK